MIDPTTISFFAALKFGAGVAAGWQLTTTIVRLAKGLMKAITK